MPSVLSLLSLAASAAAPIELGDAAQAAAAAAPHVAGELDILKLVLGASLPVKLVMGLLLAASLMSWTIILGKRSALERAKKTATGAWSTAAGVLEEAFAEIGERAAKNEALRRAYAASGKTVAEFAEMYGMDLGDVLKAVL